MPAVERSGVDGAEVVHVEEADRSVALEVEELRSAKRLRNLL